MIIKMKCLPFIFSNTDLGVSSRDKIPSTQVKVSGTERVYKMKYRMCSTYNVIQGGK